MFSHSLSFDWYKLIRTTVHLHYITLHMIYAGENITNVHTKAHDYFLIKQIKLCVLSPPAYYDLRLIRAEFLRHFPIDQVMAAYLLNSPHTPHTPHHISSKLLSLGHPALGDQPYGLPVDRFWKTNKTSVTVK